MSSAFSAEALKATGFQGFVRVADLRASRASQVIAGLGVYVVLRERDDTPEWLPRSRGGWFKGRDPSVAPSVLASNWVAGATVIYIGMTGELRRRLRQLVDFGASRPVGHWADACSGSLPETTNSRLHGCSTLIRALVRPSSSEPLWPNSGLFHSRT